MSASLVGSEMCIRDRRSQGQGRRLGPPGPQEWLSPRSCWRLLFQGAWAVSYTHLTLPTICSV
eukprot:7320503-Alexandrium_andersonii.AAC.1